MGLIGLRMLGYNWIRYNSLRALGLLHWITGEPQWHTNEASDQQRGLTLTSLPLFKQHLFMYGWQLSKKSRLLCRPRANNKNTFCARVRFRALNKFKIRPISWQYFIAIIKKKGVVPCITFERLSTSNMKIFEKHGTVTYFRRIPPLLESSILHFCFRIWKRKKICATKKIDGCVGDGKWWLVDKQDGRAWRAAFDVHKLSNLWNWASEQVWWKQRSKAAEIKIEKTKLTNQILHHLVSEKKCL